MLLCGFLSPAIDMAAMNAYRCGGEDRDGSNACHLLVGGRILGSREEIFLRGLHE